MGFPSFGNAPMKNGHMLCCALSAHLNMKRPNGCSLPSPTLEIAPPHLGVSPSNRGLGMLFPRYVPCLSFVHLQLYSTPLTPSCPLPSHSKECFRQFCAPVLFIFRLIFAKYLEGEGTERLRRIFLVLVHLGNVVFIT